MFKNYWKIAFRNLLRNKGFSFLNISGLAIGMASAVLIMLWIQNEVGYDRFHEKTGRLFEIWHNDKTDKGLQSSEVSPEMLAPTLKKDYPEVEEVSRVSSPLNYLFALGEKNMKAKGLLVDSGFLQMFSFPLITGNTASVLNTPYSIVLTETFARNLFGSTDPVGKMVWVENAENYIVTGIVHDPPSNTRFSFDFLLSYEHKNAKHFIDSDWTDFSGPTYALLKPGTSPEAFNAKIKNIVAQHSNGRHQAEMFAYPLSRLRLYSKFENGKAVGGKIAVVRIFGIIALFILLIACINFMNLSTARSEKRAKEVGIRKVIGAQKASLIGQFIGESLLISLLAGIIALVLVQLSLPAFSELVRRHLSIDYGNPLFWLSVLGFIAFTGLLAGSYPAFFLSSYKPVVVLKGSFRKINTLVTPRKVLVVTQFSFAIVLIICTLVVSRQVKYAQERQPGYDRNNLIYTYIEGDIKKNYGPIKDALLQSGAATAVCKTLAPLTQNWSSGSHIVWQGKEPDARISINRFSEDGGMVAVAGLKLVEGRDIDLKLFPADSTACLINESALKIMGFKHPLGQTIEDYPDQWHVVGVIKDFLQESPYDPVKPLLIKGAKSGMSILQIKLSDSHSITQNIASVEKIFHQFNPAYPFEYHFVDLDYEAKFLDEQKIASIGILFGGLSILIACIGLFGLATYMAENRIKEIGIRKVLGASAANITALLSKDFVRLVLLSIVIASPIGWWAMNKWLEGYQYRIHITPVVFIVAGALALCIALLTVSYQSLKAALANPVRNLRTE
ncbi:MAG TPA: ABC transporter permease [Chitinophagaceae bacterium]|jgi:ABC-type antimicrobial peptide transport system permease subunit